MSDRLDSKLETFQLLGGTHQQITIEGVLDAKYVSVKWHFENQMVHGVDMYPDSCSKAQNLLVKFIPEKTNKNQNQTGNKTSEGSGNNNTDNVPNRNHGGSNDTGQVNVLFLQHGVTNTIDRPPVAGTDRKIYPNKMCFTCGHHRHVHPKCPSKDTNFQGLQYYSFNQEGINSNNIPQKNAVLNNYWLLLESSSIFSSLCNNHMLLKYCNCYTMVSYTNAR